jgi:hypothetical protein
MKTTTMQIRRVIRQCFDILSDICHQIVYTVWFLAGCYWITEVVTKPLIEFIKIHYR